MLWKAMKSVCNCIGWKTTRSTTRVGIVYDLSIGRKYHWAGPSDIPEYIMFLPLNRVVSMSIECYFSPQCDTFIVDQHKTILLQNIDGECHVNCEICIGITMYGHCKKPQYLNHNNYLQNSSHTNEVYPSHIGIVSMKLHLDQMDVCISMV